MKFTHLHVHSHYSLLDGMAKIDQLLDLCWEHEMSSLAITDHGTMYGAVEFYQKAKKRGIRPIIGCEVYVAAESMHQKRPGIDDKRYHLVLLVKDDEGYGNLVKLVTKAHLEGFYYKPRIDKDLLREHAKGLIGLSACIQGEVPRAVINNKPEQAEQLALEYQDIFGKDNFYLELEHHPAVEGQDKANQGLIAISQKTGIPLIAANDVHYLREEDAEAQDVLMAINTDKKAADRGRLSMKSDNFSLRTPQEMTELFKDTPEAISNTIKIAQMCNFQFTLGKNQLPHFEVPGKRTPDEYLTDLCNQGLTKYYGVQPEKETLDRLDYELDVIKKTGFASYFLIVADFVSWAKSQGIVCGPGRGSAAGSIISYLLNITEIDPLKYNLLFERFLTPERAEVSMPDIDLDFADVRRDEVIDYVRNKYGSDHVAQIITFGTMASKAAIRDVGRALDYSYSFCDQLAKMVPLGLTLEKAINDSQELHNSYESDEATKKLIDTALKLEGVARHASTHAAGVVITRDPIDNLIPRQHPSQNKDIIVTQYEMHSVEALGILKMDFLGLKTLTVIENILNQVKARHNIVIDIENLPLDDKKTFTLFKEANTTGVFQLESGGMKRNLRDLKPNQFEDIIAMVALYRPGPMEFIPDFIGRKHGHRKIQYIHPLLKPILENTYGICVYQEQLMQIARDLAGFTLTEADSLRKAVGKKIKKLLDEQKDKLTTGMIKKNIDKETAEKIWNFIEPFAHYGFNKCLTDDTEIVTSTGEIFTIKELLKQKKTPKALSCAKDLKLEEKKIIKVFANGIKPVYKITTRLGKVIKATHNHPFLTVNGWQELKDLKVGHNIALARKIPIAEKGLRDIKNHQLITLGYLLAEGNLCHPQSFYYYSTDKDELKDYKTALEKFKNTKATFDSSKKTTAIYAGRINTKKSSEAVEWIKEIGLMNKKAVEKEFPSFVFRLNKKQLSLLLGKMFQGERCVYKKNKDAQIYYATSSLKLARQLQHLFLRIGVISTLYTKKFKYRKTIKKGYTLNISRYQNILNFYRQLGPYLIGKPKITLEKIVAQHPILNKKIKKNSARGSQDIIPAEILELIREEIRNKGYKSLKEFAQKAKISERLIWTDRKKKGFLRETISIIANKLNSSLLQNYANSDIYWDVIKKIEPLGKKPTFDLTIQDTHNFLANDFIVHNSHATCYALLGYQTAYLKAYYPTEFMAALMTADFKDIERIAFLVDESKQIDIKVLAPNINESNVDFTVIKDGTIRFGLKAVKNVGHNIVQIIVEERDKKGPYKSMADFIERVQSRDLNKKSMESLIKCGAFDEFDERNKLLHNLEQMLSFAREIQKAQQNGQASLFGAHAAIDTPSFKLDETDKADPRECLAWEKELLGLYISQHPCQYFEAQLAQMAIPCKNITRDHAGSQVKVGGVISKIKKIMTRSGQPMLFVELEDLSGKIEAIVFTNTLEQTAGQWQEDKVVVVKGRVTDRDGNLKIICNDVKVIG